MLHLAPLHYLLESVQKVHQTRHLGESRGPVGLEKPGFPLSRMRVNLRKFATVLADHETSEAPGRHSREGGNPDFGAFPGFPPSRE
jgi:hypothetical protein